VAEAGRIKLLRESFNLLTMAQAQLPNGVADIGPPDDQAHPFRSSARRVQIRQCGLGRWTVLFLLSTDLCSFGKQQGIKT
jgi:hypothetical protein